MQKAEVTIAPDETDEIINLDDFALFLSVMREKEAYRSVISIILDEDDIEIVEVKVENVILNKSGKRAIRLDAWAIDSKERHFAMEMQNKSNTDSIPKRSRFYQSLIDSPILKAGKRTRYRYLPSTVIIFITKEDIFRQDLAMYTFVEKCEELPVLNLEDGTKKIFLNMASLNGRDELISLLQYMKDGTLKDQKIYDNRIRVLDKIVKEVKESEEWERYRMNIWEQGKAAGISKGMSKGIIKGKSGSIFELLSDLGTINDDLHEKITNEQNLSQLSAWLKLAARSESIDDFVAHM